MNKTTQVFSTAAGGINSLSWNCAKERQNFDVLSDRAMRSGGIAPCDRTVGTRWSLVVSFTFWHLLHTRLSGSRAGLGGTLGEKCLPVVQPVTRSLHWLSFPADPLRSNAGRPIRDPVTTLTELPRWPLTIQRQSTHPWPSYCTNWATPLTPYDPTPVVQPMTQSLH